LADRRLSVAGRRRASGGLLGARFGDKRLTLFGLGLMSAGGLWLAIAQSLPSATARLLSGTGAVVSTCC
jgi:hypothetical protein